ncbi:hypothetical protein TKK_0011928 [Trichogramma kaykai]|uniref:Peptidase S8/S53 domain-containing protein n=1 Tax=Trichogramma kaykai TaxID=54128 RepID=A0ABD2WP89_9HYME
MKLEGYWIFVKHFLLLNIIGTLCSNTTESLINLKYTISSENVDHQYIVQFKGYYNKIAREKFISYALAKSQPQKWKIIERNNFSLKYPSDFDIIEVEEDKVNVLNALKRHPLIKQVTPEKLIKKQPKYYSKENEFFEKSTQENDNERSKVEDYQKYIDRKLFGKVSTKITTLLHAESLWKQGITGKGVKVAVFDTGLAANHPHFKHIKERTNWTNEKTLNDLLGHGTFVAGVIASSYPSCKGLAPDVDLYIFRVFTNSKISYTSWFLDAFNYAMLLKIKILNLSIGGPDFLDQPFVDKVWELTANGIIMISAIGNDGPIYGTLNNPADQMDVIGVGGITWDNQVAGFSSRGMTTWELPAGYGRVKPDLVTFGSVVSGSSLSHGCRLMSGTSVASPVVTGAVALLTSAFLFPNGSFHHKITPASVKQALMETATKLPNIGMFEQGAGRLDLLSAYNYLNSYVPKVTLSPSYIDLTECQYMWPYCTQAMYHTGMPTIINVTITNGLDVFGRVKYATWHPHAYNADSDENIQVTLTYSEHLWPWSGWLAVAITIPESLKNYRGVAQGMIKVVIQSETYEGMKTATARLPVQVKVIPTPPRQKRILWDQYHNLRYPSGYFPRDDLERKEEPLDWNGDHIHTNFKDLYQHLRSGGYYLEVLGTPFTCFDAKNYGSLLIVDPEEEFFPEEIEKLKKDVEEGLSVIVFADWYNVSVMYKVKIYDENTKQWWIPDTGGANIPALNDLLFPNWGIAFGEKVLSGKLFLGEYPPIHFSSGTRIIRFPEKGFLLNAALKNLGEELLTGYPVHTTTYEPVLGMFQTKEKTSNDSLQSGKIIVYGDSSCLDAICKHKPSCFWMLDAILQYTTTGRIPSVFINEQERLKHKYNKVLSNNMDLPIRSKDSRLSIHSKVLKPSKGANIYNSLPACPIHSVAFTPHINQGRLRYAYNIQNATNVQSFSTESDDAFTSFDFLNRRRVGRIIIDSIETVDKESGSQKSLNWNPKEFQSDVSSGDHYKKYLFIFITLFVFVFVAYVWRRSIRRSRIVGKCKKFVNTCSC